jgi:hypothetical protein
MTELHWGVTVQEAFMAAALIGPTTKTIIYIYIYIKYAQGSQVALPSLTSNSSSREQPYAL